MGKRSLLLIVVAVAVLSAGCGSTQAPQGENLPQYVRVITPDDIRGRDFDPVGELETTQPIGASGEDEAIRAAKDNLRRRAAKLDADAVVIGHCGVGRTRSDPMSDLTPTVVCQGLAIRWKLPRPS